MKTCPILLIAFCFPVTVPAFAPRPVLGRPMARMSTASHALAQHAPEAISLFNNMKTPASIIAGALVPLGVLDPLPITNEEKPESGLFKTLRLTYQVIGILSLMSELVSVMWATVAVNQLIETDVAPAENVWHLLRRDFDLPWLGTNAHFVGGMLGFAYLLACRTFFRYGGGLMGMGVAGLAYSGLLLMISIVNRGVSSESKGELRYGRHIGSLFASYLGKLFKQTLAPRTFGPLELVSIVTGVLSFVAIGTAMEKRKHRKQVENVGENA